MYIIKGLRLNRFQKVALPTRRQMYERYARSGMLQATRYQEAAEGDEYGDPVNFTDGMNKVDIIDAGSQMLQQSYDISQQKKK